MPAEDPDQLRERLVDALERTHALADATVANAVRTVPRHAFALWPPIHQAYAYGAFPVPTMKGDGLPSISQPSTVTLMLEALQLEPGHNVLEIGTGTGYNAALLATIVGPAGYVSTIDIEPELTQQAAERLRQHDITNVDVICGDGTTGCSEHAPYNRIIATVGVQEIPWAWADQLSDRGIILAPVHLGGEPQDHVLLKLRKEDGHLVGEGIDAIAIIALRRDEPKTDASESGRQGPDWRGARVDALRVHIYAATEHHDPNATQKILDRARCTIVLERSQSGPDEAQT